MKTLAAIAKLPVKGLRSAVEIIADMTQLTPDRNTPPALVFSYKNHKGKTSIRHVAPISIRYGQSQFHPKPTYLMRAFDFERNGTREFDMHQMGGADRVMLRETLKLAVDLMESIDRDPAGSHASMRKNAAMFREILADSE